MGRKPKHSFKPFSRFLLDTLSCLRDEGLMFDIVLQCGETLFRAHRLLLAAYSPLFKQFLTSQVDNFSASKLNIIVPIQNVGHMRLILDFLYTGTLDLSSNPDLQSLMLDVEKLQIPSLMFYIREIATEHGDGSQFVLKKSEIRANHSLVSEHFYRTDIENPVAKDKRAIAKKGWKRVEEEEEEEKEEAIEVVEESLPSAGRRTEMSLRRKQRKRSSNVLNCRYCSFTSMHQSSLSRHMHSHERKVFRCPLCLKCFANKLNHAHLSCCRKNLKKKKGAHKLKVRPERLQFVDDFLSKRLECRLCCYEARSPVALLEHCITVHTNFKMHLCVRCKTSFKAQSQREAHQKICGGTKVAPRDQFLFKRWSGCFQCSFCSFRSPRKGVVAQHLHTAHKTCMRCSSCRKRFANEFDAQTHLKMHPGCHFCDCCGSMHRDRSSLWKHEMLTHGVRKQGFKCSECKYLAISTTELVVHRADCHRVVKGLMSCSKCSKGYSSYERLRSHMDSAHAPGINEEHICGICSYRAVKLTDLQLHLQETHANEGHLICRICKQRFPTQEEITEHVNSVHPGVEITSAESPLKRRKPASSSTEKKGLICSLCDEAFPSAELIKCHVEEAHPGVSYSLDPLPVPLRKKYEKRVLTEEYICGLCEQRFEKPEAITQHIQDFHPGVQVDANTKKIISKQYNTLYQCCYCSYRHHIRSRLLRHEAFHTGNFPLKCKECGYGAFDHATMKRHFRRHNKPMDYMCHECGKAYNTYSGYRLHVFAHRGEGVHKCPLCGKDFHSPSSKVAHMFDHEGKKAYGCHLCSFECKYPTPMRRHLLQEHNFKAKKIFPRYHLLSFKARQRTKKFCPELVDQNSTDPIEETAMVEETAPSLEEGAMEGLNIDPVTMVLDMGGQEVVMVDEATLSGQSVIFIQDVAQ